MSKEMETVYLTTEIIDLILLLNPNRISDEESSHYNNSRVLKIYEKLKVEDSHMEIDISIKYNLYKDNVDIIDFRFSIDCTKLTLAAKEQVEIFMFLKHIINNCELYNNLIAKKKIKRILKYNNNI